MSVSATVKVTPWQPSGAPAAIETTLAIDSWPVVELAGAASDRPEAVPTVTLLAGQLA